MHPIPNWSIVVLYAALSLLWLNSVGKDIGPFQLRGFGSRIGDPLGGGGSGSDVGSDVVKKV